MYVAPFALEMNGHLVVGKGRRTKNALNANNIICEICVLFTSANCRRLAGEKMAQNRFLCQHSH